MVALAYFGTMNMELHQEPLSAGMLCWAASITSWQAADQEGHANTAMPL
jgi:hypothetical protein